mmetsp:Transcript_7823/g.14373  ORF Transcript_7823/g.14373 Transcript_7823/m.14373 type:complete len:658 (+) Transcript_7823:77-2050(+)
MPPLLSKSHEDAHKYSLVAPDATFALGDGTPKRNDPGMRFKWVAVAAISAAAAAGLFATLASTQGVKLDAMDTPALRRVLVDTCPIMDCGTNYPGCECTQILEEKELWLVVVEWLLIVILVCLSALFSGLTLGLMSLDLIGLEIVIGGSPDSADAKYAKKIQPVRRKGNFLLCTLLLGNVMVNSALSILLASYTGGAVGFVASTAVIVVFGEIFPQAACSRYALKIGAFSLPIVYVFFFLLFPLAKPISMVLDCIFDEDVGAIYSGRELNKLVEIHLKHKMVDEEQAKIMGGALQYSGKTVKDVMTPKDDIFMLQLHDRLNFETMSHIFQAGYSRIPVYDLDRDDVVGVMLTKDLIMVDPEDQTSVQSIIQFFGRPLHSVFPDTALSEALALFRSGKTHLAIVKNVVNDVEDRDPFYEVGGLVTLEDIVEEILQAEILDETDDLEPLPDGTTHKVDRSTFDFARLRLLDSHAGANELSVEEASAVTAHLSSNLGILKNAIEVNQIDLAQIQKLVSSTAVLELKKGERLYISGRPITHCTLILSGKMDVTSGMEGFRSSMGPWSLVGQSALNLEKPAGTLCDFTAVVTSDEGLRCLRISRFNFEQMITAKSRDKKGTHLSNTSKRVSSTSPRAVALEPKEPQEVQKRNSSSTISVDSA